MKVLIQVKFQRQCLNHMVLNMLFGHSERRAYYHETDEDVNQKLIAAVTHDITPIVCVGESLEIREAGTTIKLSKTN
jgi:triosephosphate isomerase (TIM)